jgi:hypothetical protein
MSELRNFNEAHQLYADKSMCCDNSVYRLKGGNMRLLFSKKPGSSRKKFPKITKVLMNYNIISYNQIVLQILKSLLYQVSPNHGILHINII